jgi:hypothetical protein
VERTCSTIQKQKEEEEEELVEEENGRKVGL